MNGRESMRFRWSDRRGTAVAFTAIDAQDLARAAVDAAIDFRCHTASRSGDGGNTTRYPVAQLHVHVGIAWSFPTDRVLQVRGQPPGRLAATLECPGLPARVVLDGGLLPGPSDVEICRNRADRWWSMALTARRNAQGLVWLFGDVRRMIEMALASQRRREAQQATWAGASGEITSERIDR